MARASDDGTGEGPVPRPRDLWGEQGLRPPVPRGPDDLPPVMTRLPQGAGDASDTFRDAPSASAPAATPAPAPAPAPSAAHEARSDALLDDEILDGGPAPRRRSRTTSGRRRRALVAVGAAVSVVVGVAWAAGRGDATDPGPTVTPPVIDDTTRLVAQLTGARTTRDLPVLGALVGDLDGGELFLSADPRRATLDPVLDEAPTTLAGSDPLWYIEAADVLAPLAAAAGVLPSDVTDGVEIALARASATPLEATSGAVVAVVRRAELEPDLWEALVAEAEPFVPYGAPDVLVVGLDARSGDVLWTRSLAAAGGAPCQAVGTGVQVVCVAEEADTFWLVPFAAADASGGQPLPVDVSCRPVAVAQQASVLYWAGSSDQGGGMCVGSGSAVVLSVQLRGSRTPEIVVTTDGRLLAQDGHVAAVRSTDGTWRAFSGLVEPGPDGTLLRTFDREELVVDLGPLALREQLPDGGTAPAPSTFTVLTAEDGATITVLGGVAWHRADLVSSIPTPAALDGLVGVGGWLVDTQGRPVLRVLPADLAFVDRLAAPTVDAEGVVGGAAEPSVAVAATVAIAEAADGTLVLEVSPGEAGPDDPEPVAFPFRQLRALLDGTVVDATVVAPAPTAGGLLGPASDDLPDSPEHPAGLDATSRSPRVHFTQRYVVTGADGTSRTISSTVPFTGVDGLSDVPFPAHLLVGGGAVVVVVASDVIAAFG